jgi:hypothetical protein
MKDHTRIDIFANIEELAKFYEWAKQFNPKTKEDMVKLLEKYKKADLVVEGFKEHVEHKLKEGLKAKGEKWIHLK